MSNHIARQLIKDRLTEAKLAGDLPLCADGIGSLRRQLVGDGIMGNRTFIAALESLHYHMDRVRVVRTGSVRDGLARGWQVSM